jgi:hypothetical protein
MLRYQARLDTRGKGVVNRRSFLKRLSVAGATSAVLPTATLFLALRVKVRIPGVNQQL